MRGTRRNRIPHTETRNLRRKRLDEPDKARAEQFLRADEKDPSPTGADLLHQPEDLVVGAHGAPDVACTGVPNEKKKQGYAGESTERPSGANYSRGGGGSVEQLHQKDR